MNKICSDYVNNPRFKQTLKLVGDFWTLRIVAVLESSDLRFCGIERALGDSNPATLTSRLKNLEMCDVVERRHEQNGDTVYCLTTQGRKLLPIVRSLHTLTDELTS